MNVELAAHILAKGKTLAPDRFPQPGPDVAQVWSEALSIVALPEQVWSAAVTMWATSMVGDRMVTPRDLIQAAYVVRDRWEQQPARKAILDEYRLARLNANYERMGLERVDPEALGRGEGDTPQALPRRDGAPVRLGQVVKFQRPAK